MFILKADQCVSHWEQHSQAAQWDHASNYPSYVVFTVDHYISISTQNLLELKWKTESCWVEAGPRTVSFYQNILETRKTFDQFSRV